MSDPIRILGLMSGSSLDGLDLALCEFSQSQSKLTWTLLQNDSFPYPLKIKNSLKEVTLFSGIELARFDSRFTEIVAGQISLFLEQGEHSPDFISSHGHTVFHEPENGMTIQIIQGAYLSSKLRIPVISDFRSQDIALGGQGAPLAPIVERDLFPGHDYYLNLGGICNLSLAFEEGFLAFDVSPCNQVLNNLAASMNREYDDKGSFAASGNIDKELLRKLNELDYYRLPGPKSLDNTWVQKTFFNLFQTSEFSVPDKLRTMVAHITGQLQRAVGSMSPTMDEKKKPKTMFITGGGAYNEFLISCIQEDLSPFEIKLIIPDPEIIESKEAILMAYMGYLRISERENVISSVTGSSKNSVAGAVYFHK